IFKGALLRVPVVDRDRAGIVAVNVVLIAYLDDIAHDLRPLHPVIDYQLKVGDVEILSLIDRDRLACHDRAPTAMPNGRSGGTVSTVPGVILRGFTRPFASAISRHSAG